MEFVAITLRRSALHSLPHADTHQPEQALADP